MAPRKLSDSDKKELVSLYRQPSHTTSTLAAKYGVSNSTVSRILKGALPPAEYSELIAQKRMAGSDKSDAAPKPARKTRKKVESTTGKKPGRRTRSRGNRQPILSEAAQESSSQPVPVAADLETSSSDRPKKVEPPKLKSATEKAATKSETPAPKETKASPNAGRRRRKRKSAKTNHDEQLALLSTTAGETVAGEGVAGENPEIDSNKPKLNPNKDTNKDPENGHRPNSAPVLLTRTSETDEPDDEDEDDLVGLDETLGDDFGDDDDELDDDELDDESLDAPEPKLQPTVVVEIIPVGEAVLPKPCYLVVDMRAELITRPLRDFADLGQIPSSEEQAKTLPVFDNHRVARRFSRNKQRVIKVPDGNLITRTSPYLQAKGITRLLVDGQVYALAGTEASRH